MIFPLLDKKDKKNTFQSFDISGTSGNCFYRERLEQISGTLFSLQTK